MEKNFKNNIYISIEYLKNNPKIIHNVWISQKKNTIPYVCGVCVKKLIKRLEKIGKENSIKKLNDLEIEIFEYELFISKNEVFQYYWNFLSKVFSDTKFEARIKIIENHPYIIEIKIPEQNIKIKLLEIDKPDIITSRVNFLSLNYIFTVEQKDVRYNIYNNHKKFWKLKKIINSSIFFPTIKNIQIYQSFFLSDKNNFNYLMNYSHETTLNYLSEIKFYNSQEENNLNDKKLSIEFSRNNFGSIHQNFKNKIQI